MIQYQRSNNPIPPLEWKEYLAIAAPKWIQLLESMPGDESKIQKFLEENPSLIPGAHGISFTSGHMPIYASVFSQPELPGFHAKYPDFMWLSASSTEVNPILIEIEALDKKWFREDGQPTSEFTQAENQIDQWRVWFSNPVNQIQFKELYLSEDPFRKDRIIPHYILIYGRRKDVEHYRTSRSVHKKTDETQMTYDRLSFSYDQSSYMTVKMTKKGVHAIAIPPTIMIGPDFTKCWQYIKNLPQFFNEVDTLSDERKKFLFERFNYGKEWLNSKEAKMHTLADIE